MLCGSYLSVQTESARLVADESLLIFDILKHNHQRMEWIQVPADSWGFFSSFKEFAKNLPVVNDAAERKVRLMQDSIDCSRDEKLRQDMILTIFEKRKSFSFSRQRKRSKLPC